MVSKTHLACNFIGKNNTKAMYKYLALEVLCFSLAKSSTFQMHSNNGDVVDWSNENMGYFLIHFVDKYV